MLVYLETPRLLLRRVAGTDAGHLHALDNDPDVMRFINGGIPTPRAAFDQQLLPVFLERHATVFGFWAVELAADHTFLGWVSLRPCADRPGDAELGYRFRRAAWGQGYATEAARRLIDLVFEHSEPERVFATTYEDNAASIRVMEKLGMRCERRFRWTPQDLAAVDTSIPGEGQLWPGEDVEYVLDNPRWRER